MLPKELVILALGNMKNEVTNSLPKVELKEYEEPSLQEDQIRIKTTLSTEKHETSKIDWMGMSPWMDKDYNDDFDIFVPKKSKKEKTTFIEWRLGNSSTGIVTEVGDAVDKFKVGDRVYGYLSRRETHVVNQNAVKLSPTGIEDQDLVCIDPAVVALMGVREGNVKLGEKVAIFGLGAIGLMAVQLSKISGASKVIAVEPIAKRRKLAKTFGADIVLDPLKCDSALEIYKATKGKGVDISLDTSGSYNALHEAIRSTCYGGTVVPVSWYHGGAKNLYLGEEWHFKRQIMVSGSRVESTPYREYPRWDIKRIYITILELFKINKLSSKDLLDPIVPFEKIVDVYPYIYQNLEDSIKIGVIYN
jgi:threonine dehydrogenase-like Zn-dependent dehydrogenase